MAEELKFKIGAIDDTKSAFDSSKKNLQDYKKEVGELIKKSKKAENPFKKMGTHLKAFQKEFSKINKSQQKTNTAFKKMSDAGDDLADTLKNVNKEDVVIAEKLAQKGKAMQQNLKGPDQKQKTDQQQKQMMDQLKSTQNLSQQTIQLLKVDKIETKNFSGKTTSAQKGLGKELGNKLSEKLDKNLSEGLGKIGAGVGMVAGGFIAAIGVAYSVMSAKATAFRQAAQQQITGLQQLGFGANERFAGQKAAGGFYSGYSGQFRGQNFYMTGQQQVEAMTAFAKQTGTNKNQLNQMMYGGQGTLPLGALTQAYGLNAGETAGTAGLFQRFARPGEGGMETLMKTMAGAEKVGMGGSRIKEFMDAMQEAVTQAVYDGSQRSNDSLVKGLETLMGTQDERLKALAPEILKSSTQVMSQAAMLGGGPQGNFMFQSVLNQMKSKGGGGSVFDVMEQLASGDWLQNAQAALTEARKRSGGNEQWTAFNLMKGMGLNISSPKAQQELAKMIEAGTTGTQGLTQELFQQEVQKRLQNTAKMIEETTKADYVESLHTLSEANLDAAKAVNSLREVITTIVDKGYELGKGATQRFFNINIGDTSPTESSY